MNGPYETPTLHDGTHSDAFQRFYDGLFRCPTGAPDADYKAICETWQKYSKASSVFLWLCRNTPEGRFWYLVSFYVKPGEQLTPPKLLWHNGTESRSIVEYCASRKDAWFISEPADWEADPPAGCDAAGGLFKAHNSTYFRDIGCRSLIAVPLIRAPEHVPDGAARQEEIEEEVTGVICLHFSLPFKVVGQPPAADAYAVFPAVEPDTPAKTPSKKRHELLGRLTAQELLRSREAMQKRTLLRLNTLAGKWLVASSRTPEKARKEYLKDLTKLINDVFKVDSLAIFYREAPACDAVVLLHSTGIVMYDPVTPKLVPPEQWAKVRYNKGEKQTGKCFESGKLLPLPDGLRDVATGNFPKTYEVAVREDGTWQPKVWTDPALILPIPLPDSEEIKSGQARALGVMRFASHRWMDLSNSNRAFDPVEIETLEFLAQQIGPVLETMARNIEVEKAIQEQRHELRNSVRMINELIDEMTQDMRDSAPEATKAVKADELWDLKYSGLLARAQVQRLYRDETENREMNTAPTEIYGQIIQRVCLIVGRRTARQKDMRVNCTVATRLKDGIHRLHVDPWYVEQAFLNILMNAVKYGNGGSPIDVVFSEYPDRTVVMVRNNGVGIEEGDEEKIFESGFRSAKAVERATGAGLGLPISRVIMRKHGGDVTLEKRTGPTIFQLTLPSTLRNGPPAQKSAADG